MLGDEVLATALLDRLLYRSEVIQLSGNSYRMEHRKRFSATTIRLQEGPTHNRKKGWFFLNNDVVLNHQPGESYLRKSGES